MRIHWISLLILLVIFFLLGHGIKINADKPYGYYDGEYICINTNDYYGENSTRDFILSHEETHEQVRKHYTHYCEEQPIKRYFYKLQETIIR